MKRNVIWAAIAAITLFAACEKQEPTQEPDPIPAPEQAYLSSFGFEAKEGVFKEKIVIDSPAEGTISFTTPVGTDASSYTDLVPVYEVTDPEAVVTDAEGNEIESGKPYDFSKDVDLYVTVKNEGGEKTTMYTVSVKAQAALVWALASEAPDSTAGDINMGINPKDGLPYIVTKMHSDAGSYGVAYKFDETLKPFVNNNPVFVETKVNLPGVGFDDNGGVYVAFREYEGKGTGVMKLDASAATYLGEPTAFLPYLEAAPAIWGEGNNVWVAMQAGKGSTAVTRRTLELALWNGSTWATEQAISATRPTDAYAYKTISNYAYGKKYIMIYNQNMASVSIYSLADGAWTTIVEDLKFKKADGTELTETSAIHTYSLDFDVASNGDIYISAGCHFLTEDHNVAVVRYRPSDQSQTIIGGVTSRIMNDDRYFSVALDANDIPYLAFRNHADGDKLYIQYIDNKTKTWSTPVAISDNAVGAPIMRFNEEGKAFIGVLNDDNRRVQVYAAK